MRGRIAESGLRFPGGTEDVRSVAPWPWIDAETIEQTPVGARVQGLNLLVERLERTEADPDPLIYPALRDPSLTVASSAALDYVVLSTPPQNDVTAAPRQLLTLAQERGAANFGAVFGGLVATGDRRILAHLFLQRHLVETQEARTQMVGCQTGFPLAPVIDFWLDWLGTLPGDFDDREFGTIAAAVSRERINARIPFVAETQRIYPAWLDSDNPIRILEQWTFEEFAERIEPRLRALWEKEEEPKAMDDVLRVWGLEA
jgi:hypothetical protein